MKSDAPIGHDRLSQCARTSRTFSFSSLKRAQNFGIQRIIINRKIDNNYYKTGILGTGDRHQRGELIRSQDSAGVQGAR